MNARSIFLLCNAIVSLVLPLNAIAQDGAGQTAADAAQNTAHEPTIAIHSDFNRLKSLAGEWIDTTGSSAGKGKVAAIYRVTSGGSVVQETVFPGTSHEMVSMYTAAGDEIVMSHYCAMGNQPRMRAKSGPGNELVFAFDGAGVADPGKDMHMHNGLIRFGDADTLYAEWQTWQDGAAGAHKAQFSLQRKAAASNP
jgi:hypothetical protein